jgi:hypothetical protein
MKHLFRIGFLLFILCSLDCTINSGLKDGTEIFTNPDIAGNSIQIKFARGSAWSHDVSFGPMKVRIIPQIAVWVEDSSGNLKQNIFVTHCFAKQQWRGIKNHPDSTYRTMSLPYWLNKMVKASNAVPTKAHPLSDAITAATPKGSFSITSHIDTVLKHGTIWCEINSSFDNNDTYPKDKPDSFNGQPSILYSGEFSVNDSTHGFTSLKYRGHGGNVGADGLLYPSDSGITTAKEILSSIQFELKK